MAKTLTVYPTCDGFSRFDGSTLAIARAGTGGETVSTGIELYARRITTSSYSIQAGAMRFYLGALTPNAKIKSAVLNLTMYNVIETDAASYKTLGLFQHNYAWTSCPLTTGVSNGVNACGGVDATYHTAYKSYAGLGLNDPLQFTLNAAALAHIQDIAAGGGGPMSDDYLPMRLVTRDDAENNTGITDTYNGVIVYDGSGSYRPQLVVTYEEGNGIAMGHNF